MGNCSGSVLCETVLLFMWVPHAALKTITIMQSKEDEIHICPLPPPSLQADTVLPFSGPRAQRQWMARGDLAPEQPMLFYMSVEMLLISCFCVHQ